MKNRKNTNIILIVIIILLFICSFYLWNSLINKRTAVIRQDSNYQQVESGKTRIKLNSSVNVIDQTMQNLNFANYNQEKLLSFEIIKNDLSIYKSGYVSPGEVIIGDFIDTENLTKGNNLVIVAIKYYSLKKEYLGQTNVKININCL